MTSLSSPARVAVLCLGVLGAGCETEIIHDINEAEANTILTVLQERGISADKLRVSQGREATYTVLVPRSDAVTAWQLLKEQNLPRPKSPGLGDVFSDPGLVPTPTHERAMLHHALAGELNQTLQALDGVLEARVHVVLPERDPLAPPDASAPAPRAAVLLRTRGPAPLDAAQIKRLVAGSVDQLAPEKVEVVIAKAAPAATSAPTAAPPLTAVGPITVAAESRGLLRVMMVGSLVLVLGLSGAVFWLLWRYRGLQRALLAAPPAPRPADAPPRNLESSLSLMERSLSRTSRSIGGGREIP